jgi:hypothetical protein
VVASKSFRRWAEGWISKQGIDPQEIDFDSEHDSTLDLKQNKEQFARAHPKIGGLEGGEGPSKGQQKEQEHRAYQGFVEEATGKQFAGFLEHEETIKVLPMAIIGKGCTITIQAPILVDSEAIKAAILEGLERVGEAIVSDVSNAEAGLFADRPGKWSYPSREYNDSKAYYGSGMVPYWSGGLLGSFKVLGPSTRMSIDMAFTAPYAGLIENGGAPGGTAPDSWYSDKEVSKKAMVMAHPHPFVGSVAFKIQENLETLGYLEVFAVAFKNKLG